MNNPTKDESKSPLILVIEDDSQIRRYLRAILTNEGYHLLEATGAQEGLKLVGLHYPDLIILDLSLPDRDGLEVMRDLREWTTTPIIVLTARSQENDKVVALDIGADDYLTKPFGTNELLARLRVALRHSIQTKSGKDEPVFTLGNLRVDLVFRKVFVSEKEVHLTPIEYQLLVKLILQAGKVVTRRQLLHEVWGPDYVGESLFLRVYMGLLWH
jgi:two-component system KDP operon response regulator KdpE